MSTQQDIIKDLFHQEFSKMVAVISKLLGLDQMNAAEDIVSETFLKASESWNQKGLPTNPTAWLYVVAKQKTWKYLRRHKIFTTRIGPELKVLHNHDSDDSLFDFSLENIRDSQLQMLFVICHPSIGSEAQMALALRILCGFGIDEIAAAFFTSKETINKRLLRAKEKIRTEQLTLDLPPPAQLRERLDNVLHIVYLLFNEGYYSQTHDPVLRKELCLDALRLGLLVTEYEGTNTPMANALLALMCFHASRFAARQTPEETLVLYDQQEESLWEKGLIEQGWYFLNRSMQGSELSSYHLEARIASWHCTKENDTNKWEEILHLYDQLLIINYSPSVALNRIFALYKARGWKMALVEAEQLTAKDNHFYHVLLGELYRHTRPAQALWHYQKAKQLAKTWTEQKGIQEKINQLNPFTQG
ncbi:MAG: RNA polymerase sigma factor [Flavisolibacter sp.]